MAALIEYFIQRDTEYITDPSVQFTHFHLIAAIAIFLIVYCYTRTANSIYLVDFACYLPPDHLRIPTAKFIEHFEIRGDQGREAMNFQAKAAERSGIGSEACLPLALHEISPDSSLNSSREETETVLFTVIKDLLTKHNINPKNIDILVSNCSLFCPTPSITSMIINKFGFRSNIISVNLGGMGCSASLLAISLAKDLLKVHKNSLALILSMEATTPNCYNGEVKSMLLANALFRMGGVAVLLSNKEEDKRKSKYKLQHLIRKHMGSDDESYQSVFQENDQSGLMGITLSKRLLHVARNALNTNISQLGPHVLPFSELFLYGWSVFSRKAGWVSRNEKVYVPNFKKAIEHFCIHAGGRAVVDAVEHSLRLDKRDSEASRMTLYRFGNTSSSSVWYELCYLSRRSLVPFKLPVVQDLS